MVSHSIVLISLCQVFGKARVLGQVAMDLFWLCLLWLLMVVAHLLGRGVAYLVRQVAIEMRVQVLRLWILNALD